MSHVTMQQRELNEMHASIMFLRELYDILTYTLYQMFCIIIYFLCVNTQSSSKLQQRSSLNNEYVCTWIVSKCVSFERRKQFCKHTSYNQIWTSNWNRSWITALLMIWQCFGIELGCKSCWLQRISKSSNCYAHGSDDISKHQGMLSIEKCTHRGMPSIEEC